MREPTRAEWMAAEEVSDRTGMSLEKVLADHLMCGAEGLYPTIWSNAPLFRSCTLEPEHSGNHGDLDGTWPDSAAIGGSVGEVGT